MTTYKQRATSKESKVLYALGFPFNPVSAFHYDPDGNLCTKSFSCDYIDRVTPAPYRQELEDFLRDHYYVMLIPISTEDVQPFGIKKVEKVIIKLWEKSFVKDFNEDTTIAVGEDFSYEYEGDDPFKAIYEALVWHLTIGKSLSNQPPITNE